MSNFAIIPDTSCDLTKSLRERFGIDDYISGMVYFPDGHAEKADLDWERHDPKEFYESLGNKKNKYNTALAPVGDIMEVYERQLQAGKDVAMVTGEVFKADADMSWPDYYKKVAGEIAEICTYAE